MKFRMFGAATLMIAVAPLAMADVNYVYEMSTSDTTGLSKPISAIDLINGLLPTIESGGFHPATPG